MKKQKVHIVESYDTDAVDREVASLQEDGWSIVQISYAMAANERGGLTEGVALLLEKEE